MIRFLKAHPQYYTLYASVAFVLFVIVCFAVQEPAIQTSQYVTTQGQTVSSGAGNSDFTPSAMNVSRSATQQLDALRLRVVNAPEDTMHVIRLARMLRDAHQTDEAVPYFKHYLALRPANQQVWLDLAQSLASLEQWDRAQEATESMLEHYPENPSALYNLGAIYANQSRIDDARQIWADVATQTVDPTIAEMATSSLRRLQSFLKPTAMMK